MNLKNLNAVLYYNHNHEKGAASISITNKTCDFVSEFVPILPIETQVMIICHVNGAPVLKITGRVYLSSKKFMRLTPITVALCENAEAVLDTGVKVPCKRIRTRFLGSPKLEPLTIVSVSANTFFLSGTELEPDKSDRTMTIIAEKPIFYNKTEISLEAVSGNILFGHENSRYAYRITKIGVVEKKELLEFIRSREIYNLRRLFG